MENLKKIEQLNLISIKQEYEIKKDLIKKRLNEFSSFYNEPVAWFYENNPNNELILKPVIKKDNERLFEEICFCILTANSSAMSGIKAIDFAREVLIKGTKEEIQKRLKKSGVRFHNRAEYIFSNRENLKKEHNFEIKKLIERKKHNKHGLRDFFVSFIKGFGYKEASHFLRNIGFFDYAILDKHILNLMKEYKIINSIPNSLPKNKYMELEKKFIEFSNLLKINLAELDLLLWSMKTGKILK